MNARRTTRLPVTDLTVAPVNTNRGPMIELRATLANGETMTFNTTPEETENLIATLRRNLAHIQGPAAPDRPTYPPGLARLFEGRRLTMEN